MPLLPIIPTWQTGPLCTYLKARFQQGCWVTLPEEMPIIAGKTIKVTTGLRVGYKEGRPSIVVEGVSLMGVPVPSAWLGGMKDMDLVEADGGVYQIFSEGGCDLSVEDCRLRVELRNEKRG